MYNILGNYLSNILTRVHVIFITSLIVLAPSILFGQTELVRNYMMEQVEYWNSEDLDNFMSYYWHSDSLMFVGGPVIKYGWEELNSRYKTTYQDAEMGRLTFSLIEVKQLSEELVFVVGKWDLKRSNDNPKGYFTLLWKKIDGEWRIIVDHTSRIDE